MKYLMFSFGAIRRRSEWMGAIESESEIKMAGVINQNLISQSKLNIQIQAHNSN